MKTTLFKYSLLLFTIFSLHIRGMKKEENFKRKANEQLSSIIEKISIRKQTHIESKEYNDDGMIFHTTTGIAYNGGHIYWKDNSPHNIQAYGLTDYLLNNSYVFDARPIEDMVIKHADDEIPKNLVLYKGIEEYRKYWDHFFNDTEYYYPGEKAKATYFKQSLGGKLVKWIEPVNKECPPLEMLCLKQIAKRLTYTQLNTFKKKDPKLLELLINYLLYNHKYLNVNKKKIINKYIPLQDQQKHINIINNINNNFQRFLNKYFSTKIQNNLYNTLADKNYPTTKTMIDEYLCKGGSILLALKYCVLHNGMLFSDFDPSDNKNIWPSLNQSQLKKSKELAHWLLTKKGGQHSLDQLFYECVINFDPKIFMRSLALVNAYHRLEPTRKKLEYVICKLINNRKTNLIKKLIDLKLLTNKALNRGLVLVIKKKQNCSEERLYDDQEQLYTAKILLDAGATNYNDALELAAKKNKFDVVKMLLDCGANLNRLFYRDEKNNKRCRLRCAIHENTRLLWDVLLNNSRIIEHDEPTNFEYLTHKEDQNITTIISMFINHNKKTGQQEIYDYGIKLYKLAFKAKKTGDTKKLREHIINQYKKQSIWYKLNYRFGKTIRKIKDFTIYTGLTTLSILGLYLFIKFSPI